MKDEDELIPTRASLLSRLKDWQDKTSWKVFFDTYWILIYNAAIKAGLSEHPAEGGGLARDASIIPCRILPSSQVHKPVTRSVSPPSETTRRIKKRHPSFGPSLFAISERSVVVHTYKKENPGFESAS